MIRAVIFAHGEESSICGRDTLVETDGSECKTDFIGLVVIRFLSLDRLALFGPERIGFRLTRSAKMMVCDHKSFSVEEETQIFFANKEGLTAFGSEF